MDDDDDDDVEGDESEHTVNDVIIPGRQQPCSNTLLPFHAPFGAPNFQCSFFSARPKSRPTPPVAS